MRLVLGLLALPAFTVSCSDEPLPENYYTFTGEMVSDYLQNRPEEFSEFIAILQRSGMYGMMATYGSYTCLAPTNAAVEEYLHSRGLTSVDQLTKEECDTLSWNHIIDDDAYFTTDLIDGNIPSANMNGRNLTFSCDSDAMNNNNVVYYINKTAYSGMIRYNARGEFNVPFGRYRHLNTHSVTFSHSKLLQRAELFNTDYSDIFDMCREDDFVFLDPPYDCVFSDYGNEEYKDGFNEDSHRQLARDFANLPCKALMVIGCTPMTEELYRGYIVDEYEKNYADNILNRIKSAAKHIVVANYKKGWDDAYAYSTARAVFHEPETAQLRLFEARHPYGTADK